MKLIESPCEETYILLLNKYYLVNNIANPKLLRFLFNPENKLLYINFFESFYKPDDQGKELAKRRNQITKDIEFYTIEPIIEEFPPWNETQDPIFKNGLEYSFEGNTIRMQNHQNKETMILNKSEIDQEGLKTPQAKDLFSGHFRSILAKLGPF